MQIDEKNEIREPYVLSESGIYNIIVTTTDKAGNSASNMYIVKIRRAQSIEVTTEPTYQHFAGDKFNANGMEVTVLFDNGAKEKTTEYTIVNWAYPLKCGNNKIEIKYNKNPEIKTELEVEALHVERILEEKEPTCTEDGCTEGKYCSVCNTIIVAQEVIPAKGHTYEEGECINCGNKQEVLQIQSEEYKIENEKIEKIQEKTTAEQFILNIETNATEIIIYNKKGEVLENDNIIATGMKVQLKFKEETKEFTIVISGDVNEDGKASILDIMMINKVRLKQKTLEEANYAAADVTKDNKVDIKDIFRINMFRLHKITEL
mgnify:FL=1